MAVIHVKRHSFLSRFKPLFPLQNLYHKVVEVGNRPQSRGDKDSACEPGEINVTKWKKMDSRSLGITRTMIPSSPYTLLKILRNKGFEAYLVGGCVRDLLLNRTPKDFDVITTADLHQVRKQFHRCDIVGHRFPICLVHIKGSVIEVSSFKTLAKHAENKDKFLVSQMPRGCSISDLNLWKNSMHRDFTINSLFFDPLVHKIYDYTNGMKDLLELKLRTLVPAHLSFSEDCARILRGLRIAARLGLSFSKDTEASIHEHALSILDLSKSRIMMEINYMLSYGAAESSLRLLQRFHILQILLPFQAAYIAQQTTRSGQCTMMLMKLFSNLDKLVSCDHPSACRLWIGLLAFHQALVTKPQDPFVILTFASVLYHQKWEDGLQFARQCGQPTVNFEPEFSKPHAFISDHRLSEKVHELALLVLDSIDALVLRDRLEKMMLKFPSFPSSGLVFIPKGSGQGAAIIFHVLTNKLEMYKKGRTSFEIDYNLLGKGDVFETRLALSKIILNTIECQVDQDGDSENKNGLKKKLHKKHALSSTDSNLREENGNKSKKQKLVVKSSSGKNQNAVTQKKTEGIVDGCLLEQEEQKKVLLKHTSLDKKHALPSSDSNLGQEDGKKLKNQQPVAISSSGKNQNAVTEKKFEGIVDGCLLEHEEQKKVVLKHTSSDKKHALSSTDSTLGQEDDHKAKKQKLVANLSSGKNQNAVTEKKTEDIVDGYLLEQEKRKDVVLRHTSSDPKVEDSAKEKPVDTAAPQSRMSKLVSTVESVVNKNFPSLVTQKPKEIIHLDKEPQQDQSITEEQRVNRNSKRKQTAPLSALFK